MAAMRGRLIGSLVALVIGVVASAVAVARAAGLELVLFQTAGCVYCQAWDRDVGVLFHLTDEARLLTLRRVEIAATRPADLRHIADVRYTPTFVVVQGGREVGRITGYLGQDQFWGLLGEILEGVQARASPAVKPMRKGGGS